MTSKNYFTIKHSLLPVIFLIIMAPFCFSQQATTVVDKSNAPAPEVLPGNGLAAFDFFYAGEAKDRNMYIVRKGKIVWSYIDTVGKGEISDAVLLSNGNILFAHQFGVTLITPDKKVLWNYDAPEGTEIHTAQPIGKEHVVFIQNGNPAKLQVVNIRTGKTVKAFELPVKNPASVHGQFRHARLTGKGTILVAHMDMGRVSEYDFNGKELLSFEVPGVWGVTALGNGNILASGNNKGYVREYNSRGDSIWNFSVKDIAGYKIPNPQIAIRRANGNTLINNWFNQWDGKIDTAKLPVQAIEITPAGKIVWALRSWVSPYNLGPATTIQILGEPGGISEKVFFGDIH